MATKKKAGVTPATTADKASVPVKKQARGQTKAVQHIDEASHFDSKKKPNPVAAAKKASRTSAPAAKKAVAAVKTAETQAKKVVGAVEAAANILDKAVKAPVKTAAKKAPAKKAAKPAAKKAPAAKKTGKPAVKKPATKTPVVRAKGLRPIPDVLGKRPDVIGEVLSDSTKAAIESAAKAVPPLKGLPKPVSPTKGLPKAIPPKAPTTAKVPASKPGSKVAARVATKKSKADDNKSVEDVMGSKAREALGD